jgi:hypothetical protein
MNRPGAQARITPFLSTPVGAGAVIKIATGVALVAVSSVVLHALIGSSTARASIVGRVLGGACSRSASVAV